MTTRPTLLLIHGFPLDHTLWDAQRGAFSDVADVLAPDLRGFGKSCGVAETVTMAEYANDLVKMLEAKGVEQVVLCGLSMGGYIAMAFLAQWPERVSALILCNTRATGDTAEGKEARYATASDALNKGMRVIARAMLPKVLSEKTIEKDLQLVREVEAMMVRQDPLAVAAASRGMALRPDRSAWLRSAQVPTLIITGAEDTLMPLCQERSDAGRDTAQPTRSDLGRRSSEQLGEPARLQCRRAFIPCLPAECLRSTSPRSHCSPRGGSNCGNSKRRMRPRSSPCVPMSV
ncbi:MAG: alpha/beta fold hydrolase [Flavobacteriales bacterium]|nr:alpha/beta fold hydrolase [Flavobacteriales bacterium]